MALIVQKYGGSSVGTLERIKHVAAKIIQSKQDGHHIVVVVSAMQGETDRLIGLAYSLTDTPNLREYDALISTGEQVSMSLLAMALHAMGYPARSYSGSQLSIFTDNTHTKARILEVKTESILKDLSEGYIVVVAGFQGINNQGDVTTLGRGGSDTTAVALAAALNAAECQIYTDVEGIYTTDPRLLPEARLLTHISFQEMLAMASLGAKVLQLRSVELAIHHHLPIRVLSTFSNNMQGTLVTFEDKILLKRLIAGIACSREEAMIGLYGIPLRSGLKDYILTLLQAENMEIEMMEHRAPEGTCAFTFTQPRHHHLKAMSLIEKMAPEVGAKTVKSYSQVAKLSLVGTKIHTDANLLQVMLTTLGNIGVDIQMVTTSPIKISVVIEEAHLVQSVRALHSAFKLDELPKEKSPTLMEI